MERNYQHLMIDLETMGQESNAAIVAIAAVEFDLETGTTGREFYRRVSLESSEQCGLHIDAATVMWWLKQKKEARKELLKEDALALPEALQGLMRFITSDTHLWGNSARFDLGILANAYAACGAEIPWNHYNERCVRTLAALRPEIKKNMCFYGIKHHPLDDCHHQIRYCHATWKALKN